MPQSSNKGSCVCGIGMARRWHCSKLYYCALPNPKEELWKNKTFQNKKQRQQIIIIEFKFTSAGKELRFIDLGILYVQTKI